MTEPSDLFRMTERQKQAWIAIMGHASFPATRKALLEAATPQWAGIVAHDLERYVAHFEDAKALGLLDGKDDGRSLSKTSRYVLRPKNTQRGAANDEPTKSE